MVNFKDIFNQTRGILQYLSILQNAIFKKKTVEELEWACALGLAANVSSLAANLAACWNEPHVAPGLEDASHTNR